MSQPCIPVNLEQSDSSAFGPHSHKAIVNNYGDGFAMGNSHRHAISNWQVHPASDGHSHVIDKSSVDSMTSQDETSQSSRGMKILWFLLMILFGLGILFLISWVLRKLFMRGDKQEACKKESVVQDKRYGYLDADSLPERCRTY